MYIQDPIEMMESRIESNIDRYVEGECMECKKQVGEDNLVVLGPMGDGPAVCWDCSGIDVESPSKGEIGE